jgi:hypothetical protein
VVVTVVVVTVAVVTSAAVARRPTQLAPRSMPRDQGRAARLVIAGRLR